MRGQPVERPNHFEGQENAGMCGPATAVIVLNALYADAPDEAKPVDRSTVPAEYVARIPPQYRPYFHRYTQRSFFDDARVSGVNRVLDDGWDDERARAEIVEHLALPGVYVVVNYIRAPLGQEGGGHISPLAAYDEGADAFLVLDVNPNRGKSWAWVPARRLLGATRTFDTIENRGYLLVRDAGP